MSTQQDVEFKTIDGITLRGRMYIASSRGPGIVMSPGFNGVKEMVGLPNVALAFQQAGLTVLMYDPRTTGLSDGEPRNDIDPFTQIDDYSDALSYLAAHSMVDQSRMGVWGMSLSGAIALACAAVDPRARFVVAVCPALEYSFTAAKLPGVLAKIAKDRESQIKGNDPFYLPMLNQQGENPAGFNLGVDKDAALRILSAQDESIPTRQSIAANHVNRTTIQSYRKLLMWSPAPILRHLSVPVMFVVPERDQLIPAAGQQEVFDKLPGESNQIHVEQGRGHMDILEGEHVPDLMRRKVSFINEAVKGQKLA
ncbi:hypothetical protein N7532_004568 [Penicillium argentinense]|uniref:Serine aminopeptidase S33 domain-containing protein n=1 Tax=Penicillium argentinense TaxID=1131581 RepID=A0A9W9KF12_9EURO|nr:uncharacterized protein N7532_004568 [Penicillium argentinense]KAJ5104039.1 hypothetical protein N7532_004568 [Penicillium argentinense]